MPDEWTKFKVGTTPPLHYPRCERRASGEDMVGLGQFHCPEGDRARDKHGDRRSNFVHYGSVQSSTPTRSTAPSHNPSSPPHPLRLWLAAGAALLPRRLSRWSSVAIGTDKNKFGDTRSVKPPAYRQNFFTFCLSITYLTQSTF